MKNSDKGFVLRRINYSDSSLILTLYTYSHGIQKFIFQGGKKKAAALFPMSLVELTFYTRPDSDLGKLTEVEPLIPLQNILMDPIRSSIAFFLADVLVNCLKTDQSDPELFRFLEMIIYEVDQSDELSVLPCRFLLEFSHHLGIGPVESDPDPLYFDLQEGEFVMTPDHTNITASGEEVAFMISLGRGEYGTDNISSQVRKNTLEILLHFYALHVPKFNVDNSLEVIREVLYGTK